MREQGSSTFSVDESGWCLDRLAGLQSVVTPERSVGQGGAGQRAVLQADSRSHVVGRVGDGVVHQSADSPGLQGVSAGS